MREPGCSALRRSTSLRCLRYKGEFYRNDRLELLQALSASNGIKSFTLCDESTKHGWLDVEQYRVDFNQKCLESFVYYC